MAMSQTYLLPVNNKFNLKLQLTVIHSTTNKKQYSSVTLTLSWHKYKVGYAHHLVEENIYAKFDEKPSISVGFKEWKHGESLAAKTK